jgi:hypothetical protein
LCALQHRRLSERGVAEILKNAANIIDIEKRHCGAQAAIQKIVLEVFAFRSIPYGGTTVEIHIAIAVDGGEDRLVDTTTVGIDSFEAIVNVGWNPAGRLFNENPFLDHRRTIVDVPATSEPRTGSATVI